jgi:hypothetical protein
MFYRSRFDSLTEAVIAGKWRVCIDTSNLLGGPFQMVFTTNGVKQVLDNVYAPSHVNPVFSLA